MCCQKQLFWIQFFSLTGQYGKRGQLLNFRPISGMAERFCLCSFTIVFFRRMTSSGVYKRIVVKAGSNVLTLPSGLPDLQAMASLVGQVAALTASGAEVVLVSSGAVASGRSIFKPTARMEPVAERQLLASIGQVELMRLYANLLEQQPAPMRCAQILVTREDFRDRTHYMNMRNCFGALLQNGVLPIVNENDVVAVTELMFTDNDELAGLVASMLQADALIILTNVEGVYDRNPSDPGATLLRRFTQQEEVDFSQFVSSSKSQFGRGGMITKCKSSLKVASLGIAVHIANGKQEGILTQICREPEQAPGTFFVPRKRKSPLKVWMSHSQEAAKGTVHLNEGAVRALSGERAASVLPVGITQVEGNFQKGDLVRLLSASGKAIGIGVARYPATALQQAIGLQNQPVFIHYDYLFLFP